MRRLFFAKLPDGNMFVSDKQIKLGHPTDRSRPGFIFASSKQETANMAFITPPSELDALVPTNGGALMEVHASPVKGGIMVDRDKSDYCQSGWTKVTGVTDRVIWLKPLKQQPAPHPLHY